MLAQHTTDSLRPGRGVAQIVWCNKAAEETDHRREVIEAALAHVVQNKVEAGLREVGPVRAPATWGGGGPCVVHCDSRTIRVGPSWFVQN